MSPETLRAILVYKSPVPLFESGRAAYEHGIREIDGPGPEALAAIAKIRAVRGDLLYRDGTSAHDDVPMPAIALQPGT